MSNIFYSDTINELRLEGKLCDAVIIVDAVEFKIHRIILCSCSSYFRDLFRSNASGEQVFSFPQVMPNIMNLIVNYAYTGSVAVTQENVLGLLAGADHFAVKGIMQACCNFLAQNLSFKNCVHIWMLADLHKCPELRQRAYLHMLRHFKEVAGFSVKFLQLSVQQLTDLISTDELNVSEESTVFEAILRWIDYASEERRCHMATLLSKVRLLLMSSKYLADTVSMNTLVRKSPLCMTMVAHAMKTLRKSNMERPLTRTRLPSALLLAIGGWGRDSTTNRIDLYDVRADRWVGVNSEEAPRAFYGCVLLDECIYCIGGYDGANYLSSVRRLNLVTQTWEELGRMHAVRCYVSAVTLDGCIYAIGGCGEDKLNSAERYQPDTRQWTLIASMHENRSNASVVTLHGKVYICGGYNKEEPLSTAECYDPCTNQWTLIAPMGNGCNAARGIAYKDRIYVIGGYRDGAHTSRVVAYDPASNQWSAVNPMINPRSSFGVAVLEDRLYVVGGFDDHGLISEVERYDEKTDSWHAVRDMEEPRSGFGCCVVDLHPHAAAYKSLLSTSY